MKIRKIPSQFNLWLSLNYHNHLKFLNLTKGKIYKLKRMKNISSLRIVSMIPGDLTVAGCFNFFNNFGGIF